MGAVHLFCLQMMPTAFRCFNSKRFLVVGCLKRSSYMFSSLSPPTEWQRACPAWLYHAGQFSQPMRQMFSFSRPAILQEVSTDALANKILAGKNCTELLDSLHNLNVATFRPEHTWLFTCCMMQLYHDQKVKEIPGLSPNIRNAFFQMNSRGNIGLKTIFKNSNFNIWQKLILKYCNYFNDQQLADCFFAVMYIGLPLDGSVVRKLIELSYVNLPKFHIVPLSLLSLTYKSLPGTDCIAIRTILERVKEIYMTVDPLQISKDELVAVMSIVIQHPDMIEKDFSRGFIAWLGNCLQRADILDKPDSVVTLLRCIFKSSIRPLSGQLVGILKKAACGIVDQFDSYQLDQICCSLQRFHYYHKDIASLMEKRAMELLLNNKCRLADVINLAYALTSSSSLSAIQQFDNAMMVRISGDIIIDLGTMSRLCEVFGVFRKHYVDSDLIINIQRHIVRLSEYKSTFTNLWQSYLIFVFLSTRPFLTSAHQQKFNENLLKHLMHGKGFESSTYDSKLFIYLLSTNFEQLNNEFYEDLISHLPKWTFINLCKLANVLIQNESTSVARPQTLKLLSCVYSSLIKKIDSVTSFTLLHEAVKNLVILNPQRDPVLSDQLINMYKKFTNIVTTLNFYKFTKSFGSTRYYLPEVYDKLSSFVVNNAKDTLNDVDILIEFCAKVGYKPRMMDKLMEIALKAYRQKWKNGDIHEAVKLLNNMSILSYYPEVEIAQLFSLRSVGEIGHYIEDSKRERNTEYQLMMLNRSIVLECPQLDIPWFHEQFCQDSVTVLKDSRNRIKFNSEVAGALLKILGGKKYFKNKSFSPYYYLIDFECFLDKTNLQPLGVDLIPCHKSAHWKDKLDSKYQKVAICLLEERDYCYNSKSLLVGAVLLKKRHLEIMDYKFVEVPYFDWYSMALSDSNSKVEYLRKKIMA